MKDIKKVVLAYSGGLDTSIILKWLQEIYDCEVVTFTADLGQGEELEPARSKAQSMDVKEIYIEDLREEFVSEYVFPMFRANAIYEGEYLLGTSIARPLIAKRLVEIAEETGADAISHGATGKGNDQVRFELGAYALNPNIKIIAHPECPPEVIKASDFAGSTSGMINYVKDNQPKKVMMVTECSMSDNIQVENPNVEFIRPCNLCPHMKKITLPKILDCLENETGEIIMDQETINKARLSVEKMVAIGR